MRREPQMLHSFLGLVAVGLIVAGILPATKITTEGTAPRNPLPLAQAFVIGSPRLRTQAPQRRQDPRIAILLRDSKWDNLVDEDDDEGPPVPPDMMYVPRNIMRQNSNFVGIREAAGKELTNDVYVREPDSGIFWFAGKVARVSDVSLEQCISRQYPLIEQHAANLRPIELFPHRGKLEIWTAPGDSELDVAYNRPNVVFEKQSRLIDGASKVKNSLIGFQGEVYQQGEEGLRTWRTEDGRPANPEVQSGESRSPSDEEIAKLNEQLKGQDLNALYEEQQRREGKDV